MLIMFLDIPFVLLILYSYLFSANDGSLLYISILHLHFYAPLISISIMFLKEHNEEDHRGIFSRAKGQTARLAMILHALYNAAEHCLERHGDVLTLSSVIRDKTMCAIALIRYCMSQKLALMPSRSQPL